MTTNHALIICQVLPCRYWNGCCVTWKRSCTSSTCLTAYNHTSAQSFHLDASRRQEHKSSLCHRLILICTSVRVSVPQLFAQVKQSHYILGTFVNVNRAVRCEVLHPGHSPSFFCCLLPSLHAAASASSSASWSHGAKTTT